MRKCVDEVTSEEWAASAANATHLADTAWAVLNCMGRRYHAPLIDTGLRVLHALEALESYAVCQASRRGCQTGPRDAALPLKPELADAALAEIASAVAEIDASWATVPLSQYYRHRAVARGIARWRERLRDPKYTTKRVQR